MAATAPTRRLFWLWLSKVWSQLRSARLIVKPETVLRCHREGVKLFRTRQALSRPSANAQVIDFLTVPTATFRMLYVFIALAHDRRRVLRFNVTEHPTAAWVAKQIIETFPDETAPRFMIRDRDQIYDEEFRLRVAGMKIEEVITAARSPWQNAYVERLIGSIRRECLDLAYAEEDDFALVMTPFEWIGFSHSRLPV